VSRPVVVHRGRECDSVGEGVPISLGGVYFVPFGISGTVGVEPVLRSLVSWFAPVSGGGGSVFSVTDSSP